MRKHYLNCRYYTVGPQARCNCDVLWWTRSGDTGSKKPKPKPPRPY